LFSTFRTVNEFRSSVRVVNLSLSSGSSRASDPRE
jgi:hypothetical protein